jgi:hypothetical protein
VIQVQGIDIGYSMNNLSSIGEAAAQQVRIGRRTIFVPIGAGTIFSPVLGTLVVPGTGSGGGQYVVVWSYVNGYPHSRLAAAITAGSTTCTLLPTDGASGLLGIIPGTTNMTVMDGTFTESFTVASVSGTTLTSTTPFQYQHTPPAAPDSIVVTTLPSAVQEAVILLTTVLIKTRGDNALVLEELTEPKSIKKATGDEFEDLNLAVSLLNPYRVRFKAGRR